MALHLCFKVLFLFSLASNVEKCRYLEKALANLTENHGQQIDELNVTHALETENLLDELNQKHQREMGQGIFLLMSVGSLVLIEPIHSPKT